MPNWVGDVVLSLPALRALRAAAPGDRLAVLCRPWVADLYRLLPEVDQVLVEDARGEHAGAAGQEALAARIAKERFDRAIVFPTSFRSAWSLARAKVPVRIGYRGELRSLLLTRSVPLQLTAGEHQVFQHLRLAEAAGAASPARPDTSWPVERTERDAGQKVLREAGWRGEPFVAVHLASFAHAAKRWDLPRFASVLEALAAGRSFRAVLLGSASEREMNDDAARLAGPARPIDLSGKSTLPEVLGILATASLFVGNDSGISHLAAAAGTPTAVVFGPTDPEATRPWDGPRPDGGPSRVAIVRRAPLCAPCRFRICPIDHVCMTAVAPGDLLAAARRLLEPETPAHFVPGFTGAEGRPEGPRETRPVPGFPIHI